MRVSREKKLSRLLILYITTGLVCMLLPGAFLGARNLIAISIHRAANSVPSGWIQVHGHAQIVGGVGNFILALLLLALGCLLRVSSEILAYQGLTSWAWS